MRLVVSVGRACFAVAAEVGIMTHSTFVSYASDVPRTASVVAERTIAANAEMNSTIVSWFDAVVDWNETVAGMDEAGIQDTIRAIVPVGAIEALVTNTFDVLVASIANGAVILVATRSEADIDYGLNNVTFGGRLECVPRMVAMVVLDETVLA